MLYTVYIWLYTVQYIKGCQVVMAPGPGSMGVKAVSLPSLFPNAAGGNVHLGYPSEALLYAHTYTYHTWIHI